MLIKAVKCKSCNDIIYSRANHDMHPCTCKGVFIDGGLSYIRIVYSSSGNEHPPFDQIDIELDVTEMELYHDWNMDINKYGLIKDSR